MRENLRVVHEPRSGAYEVADWDKPSRAVTSTAGPGRSNGVTAISDPRLQINGDGNTNLFRVQLSDDPATCITGAAGPNQGAPNISDPNLTTREGRHPGVYRIVPANEPAPCVTGTRFGSGAIAVADPRVNTKLHPDSYGVQDWDATAKTVRSANRIMQAAGNVSDPRVPDRPGRYTDQFRMQSTDGPAATVTGSTDVQYGAQLIADPRIKSKPRADTMGVQNWNSTAKTVTGSMDVHAGAAAVADPRIPSDKEQGVWMILAPDVTWHRPLTTYELAMIQSFATHLPNGRPFQLVDCSDAKAREYTAYRLMLRRKWATSFC